MLRQDRVTPFTKFFNGASPFLGLLCDLSHISSAARGADSRFQLTIWSVLLDLFLTKADNMSKYRDPAPASHFLPYTLAHNSSVRLRSIRISHLEKGLISHGNRNARPPRFS